MIFVPEICALCRQRTRVANAFCARRRRTCAKNRLTNKAHLCLRPSEGGQEFSLEQLSEPQINPSHVTICIHACLYTYIYMYHLYIYTYTHIMCIYTHVCALCTHLYMPFANHFKYWIRLDAISSACNSQCTCLVKLAIIAAKPNLAIYPKSPSTNIMRTLSLYIGK